MNEEVRMMKKASTKIMSLLPAVLLMAGLFTPALADGELLVGEVTVIATNSVNVRSGGSTQYPIIATAKSGELFQTTGQVPGGWYEILLPDNTFGYVSDKLLYFVPYPVPIPIGSGPQQFTVPVYYRTRDGQLLKQVDVPVVPGQSNVITADDSQVPGYRLVSTRSVYVWVDATGRPNPSGVIFNYELMYVQPTQAPQTSVNLPVYYRNIYNQVIATEYRLVTQGTQLVRADAAKLPAGYYLTGSTEAVVTVTSYGTASPAAINFTAAQNVYATPVPQTFEVPVSYRDEQGRILLNTSQPVQPGYTTVSADDSRVPAGMQLSSARSVVVYCSSQGVTFPSTVVFTYRSAISATIQVIYQDQSGATLYSENRQLAQGTQTITADNTRVPAGYQLQGSSSVQVTVYSNGTVSQNRVVFVYALPVRVSLPVYYRDTNGAALYSENQTLGQGTVTITANDGRVPAGYVLQSARSVNVTVYANGTASPSQVVFLYARPVSANVQIVYRDSNGTNLYTETRTYQQGSHTVTANDGRAPSGYVLQSARNVNITVYADGSVSPSQVIFTYAPPAPPVTVNVPVIYKDQDGAVLFQTSVAVSSASPQNVTADKSKAPAGYVLSGPSTVKVTVSPNGTANPSQVVFTFRDPATITEAQMLPAYTTFRVNGDYPVYSGPDTTYYRAASGRAMVGGGQLRLWGFTGDWALIGYGLSNNLYRIGYIQRSGVPADVVAEELFFGSQTATITAPAVVNDDPIIKPTKIFELPKGAQVTLLAYLNETWAYIETTFQNQPIRGFVRRQYISVP